MYLQRHCQIQGHLDFFHVLSFGTFKVSHFIVVSLSFELIFVRSVGYSSNFFSFPLSFVCFFLACECLSVSARFAERLSFLHRCFLCFFVKDQLNILVPISEHLSIPLIYFSVLSPISHFLDYCTFIVSLEGS